MALSKKKIQNIRKLSDRGLSQRKIESRLHVSLGAINKYLKKSPRTKLPFSPLVQRTRSERAYYSMHDQDQYERPEQPRYPHVGLIPAEQPKPDETPKKSEHEEQWNQFIRAAEIIKKYRDEKQKREDEALHSKIQGQIEDMDRLIESFRRSDLRKEELDKAMKQQEKTQAPPQEKPNIMPLKETSADLKPQTPYQEVDDTTGLTGDFSYYAAFVFRGLTDAYSEYVKNKTVQRDFFGVRIGRIGSLLKQSGPEIIHERTLVVCPDE